MRLGSAVAPEAAWNQLEKQWPAFLLEHQFPRLHMKELMHGSSLAKLGKSREEANSFIKGAINFLLKDRAFRFFLCEINLAEYSKVNVQNARRKSPEAVCVDYCVGQRAILEACDVGQDDVIKVYFDQGEPYLRMIDRVYRQMRKRRMGWSTQVAEVLAIDSLRNPQLQIPDLIVGLRSYGEKYQDHAFRYLGLECFGSLTTLSLTTQSEILAHLNRTISTTP